MLLILTGAVFLQYTVLVIYRQAPVQKSDCLVEAQAHRICNYDGADRHVFSSRKPWGIEPPTTWIIMSLRCTPLYCKTDKPYMLIRLVATRAVVGRFLSKNKWIYSWIACNKWIIT